MSWLRSIFSYIIGMFTGTSNMLPDLQPVVSEGEQIVVSLTSLIADLKTNNFVGAIADGKDILTDVTAFVADLNKVVNDLKAKQGN